MARIARHTRLLEFAANDMLYEGRLDDIHEATGPGGTDLLLDIQRFEPTEVIATGEEHGRHYEEVRGWYTPMRVRFRGATVVRRAGAFATLDQFELEAVERRLTAIFHIRDPKHGELYIVGVMALETGNLMLHASEVVVEPRSGDRQFVTLRRWWEPTPHTPTGLVPMPAALHRKYGGDPIAIRLNGRVSRRRLFIGGMHHQGEQRPDVDAVLNLCGEENPWVCGQGAHPRDRVSRKGEMFDGMRADDVLAEGRWVADRLRAGERVLVHCYAGMNRSATVCCAALILLEGISAEEALERVRERHPVAWPDPYHWKVLRRLAASVRDETPDEWASVLRESVAIG